MTPTTRAADLANSLAFQQWAGVEGLDGAFDYIIARCIPVGRWPGTLDLSANAAAREAFEAMEAEYYAHRDGHLDGGMA